MRRRGGTLYCYFLLYRRTLFLLYNKLPSDEFPHLIFKIDCLGSVSVTTMVNGRQTQGQHCYRSPHLTVCLSVIVFLRRGMTEGIPMQYLTPNYLYIAEMTIHEQ